MDELSKLKKNRVSRVEGNTANVFQKLTFIHLFKRDYVLETMNKNLLVRHLSNNLVFSKKLAFSCFRFYFFICINAHFVYIPPQKVYIQQRNSNIFFLADRVQTLGSCKSK